MPSCMMHRRSPLLALCTSSRLLSLYRLARNLPTLSVPEPLEPSHGPHLQVAALGTEADHLRAVGKDIAMAPFVPLGLRRPVAPA